MGITYTTAPTVAVGDCLTSTVWNQFADAINDRLKGGVADPTWRIWWRAGALVRQMCPNDEFAAAAFDEWFRFWCHADPRLATGAFECSGGLGEENPLNPLAGFAYGNTDAFALDAEDARLPAPAATDASLAVLWATGAAQRGGMVPAGEWAAPAWSAARSHEAMDYSQWLTPYLKSYGGFFTIGLTGAEAMYAAGLIDATDYLSWAAWGFRCGANPADYGDRTDDPYGFTPTVYIFSPLKDTLSPLIYVPDALASYDWDPSGCAIFNPTNDPLKTPYPEANSAAFLLNIKSVTYGTDRYILTRVNGDTVELLYEDYVEGPYGGATSLKWGVSPLLAESLQWFASDFRGSDVERAAAGYKPSTYAFDFQTFFTRQYLLAPAYAELVGSTVTAIYPDFAATEPTSGTWLTYAASDEYQIHDAFVFAGYYAHATGLLSDLTIEIYNATTLLTSFTLSASNPAALVYFASPATAPLLKIKVANAATWSAGGEVVVEVAELAELKPQAEDAYLVIRSMSTLGEGVVDLDTGGLDSTTPKSIWTLFAEKGCLVNNEGVPLQSTLGLTQNPVYDQIRQMLHSNLRMIDRVSYDGSAILKSYELVGGKSILRFERYMSVDAQQFDLWKGLVPEGAATEGIVTTASAQGKTNEWVMFLGQNPYNYSEANDFKPASYGDVLTFLPDRCTLFDTALDGVTGSYDLSAHIGYAQDGVVTENPSGYRYAASGIADYGGLKQNLQAATPGSSFLKSCQVYVPDYEVESVTLEDAGATVRVQLASRLRHTDLAAATIGTDPAGWNVDVNGRLLDSDDNAPIYRTDENAVMEMILDDWGSGPTCRAMTGDWSSDPNGFESGLNGSCHCHFYFTKLMPKVYDDGNDVMTSADTPIFSQRLQWAHFIIAAACEGYVDQNSSIIDGCPPSKLADYSFRRLCMDVAASQPFEVVAHTEDGNDLVWDDSGGGQWTIQYRDTDVTGSNYSNEATVDASPYTKTYTAAKDTYRVVKLGLARDYLLLMPLTVRGDGLRGFGSMANTCAYVEVLNQYSRALNLLTIARLELPLDFQRASFQNNADASWSPDFWENRDCNTPGCTDGHSAGSVGLDIFASGTTSFGRTPAVEEEEWDDWSSGVTGATLIGGIGSYDDDANPNSLHCDANGPLKRVTELRYCIRIDPDANMLDAVSDHIRDMCARPAVLLNKKHTFSWYTNDPSGVDLTCQGGTLNPPPCSITAKYISHQQVVWECGLSVPSGPEARTVIEGPDLPEDTFYIEWMTVTGGGVRAYCGIGPSIVTDWGVTVGNAAIWVPLV